MLGWQALVAWAQRVPVAKFNFRCFVLAFTWLAITVPLGLYFRPTWPDFSQFYMGGVIVRMGEWQGLYPIPNPDSIDNPGLHMNSIAKPEWEAIRQMHNVPNDTRFILPPPSALLFVPLSFLPLLPSYWTWLGVLTLCVFATGLLAARLNRYLTGRPSRIEGMLALLVVVSPMTARAIRIGNVSPLIAFLLGVAIWMLVKSESSRRSITGAFAILIGALLKYATLVIAPLLLAKREWKMILWLMCLGSLFLIATLLVGGAEPFVEYYRVIMPTLSRPSEFLGNQSLPGFFVRVFGRPLPVGVSLVLTVSRLVSLSVVLVLIFRVKRRDWSNPRMVYAGAASLITWLLIFSPIAWEHWPVFLCPLWGWMIERARVAGVSRSLALSSFVLMNFPAGLFHVGGFLVTRFSLPEPFNSWQLAGIGLAFVLSCKSLAVRSEEVGERRLASVA